VVIRTQFAAPELIDTLSAKTDLAMESKARWDAGAMAGGRWFDEGPQSHSRVSSGEEICSILEDWKL
jgi:hypothetical protein